MLINDAEERISSLEQIIKAFVGHEGRAFGSEFDAKSGKHRLYVQFPTPVPAKIRMEIRAVARDLRDALDHAVYASAISISGGNPLKTKFLVADTPDGIQQEIARNRCKDVHDDIVAYMVEENACEAGNKTIWSLNQFRNVNSHRVVSLSSAGSAGVGINHLEGGATFDVFSEWHSTSRRLYYAAVKPTGSQLNLQIRPEVEIRIHPQFGLGERSATIELRDLVAEVARIVREIEGETARILGG